ncbi:MAG: hypothetical protein H0X37_15420 [Herpetosiphonaceae bacterium]|nr:hypothetical protein [Herpetosiphonaceae bacterium]
MKHTDEHISNRAVRLDGEDFHNCVFEECTLEIGGAADCVLDECSFIDCKWAFVGAAATTLALMARLSAGLVPDGKALMEQLFADIRRGAGFGQPFKLAT